MTTLPLVRANLWLAGGWRNFLLIAAIYLALLVAGSTANYNLVDPKEHGAVSATWLGLVAAAQGIFLLLVAPGAIRKAVLRDYQTGMIESHRLTPLGSFNLISGYMLGPPLQSAVLYAVSLVAGAYFASHYAASMALSPWAILAGWLLLQASLLVLSLMLAALTLLTSLASAGKANIIGIVALAGVLSGWAVVVIVPGVALVAGMLSGNLFWDLMQGKVSNVAPSVLPITVASQLVFAAIFLRAACVRMRAPHRGTFSVWLGLLLVLAWGTTLVAGLFHVPPSPIFGPTQDIVRLARLVASTSAFLVIALVPLSASISALLRRDQQRSFGERAETAEQRVAPLIHVLLAMMTAAVMYSMYRVMSVDGPVGRLTDPPAARVEWSIAAISLLAAYWTAAHWLYLFTFRVQRMLLPALLWLLFFVAMPIIADMLLFTFWSARSEDWTFADGYFSGASPVGTLILCTIPGGNPAPGVAIQALIAAAITWPAVQVRRRVLRGTPPAPPRAIPRAGA